MVLVMVAVALVGGNCGLDLYATAHAHSASGQEFHAGHSHGLAGEVAQLAAADANSEGDATGSDHPGHSCPYAHVHCCATLAIAATACDIAFEHHSQSMIFDHVAAVAYGQLPYPPLRPPRAVA